MSTTKAPISVNCPTCQTQVEWKETAKFRPFCSERCQQIDLGAWSAEEYRIAAEPTEEWSGDQTNNPEPSEYTLQ